MSMIPNAVAEIVPASYSAADILTALHTYLDATSTTFTVDLVSGSGASDGFSLQSIADPGYQMILRRTGASTIEISTQPGATVTDVGNVSTPPTGTNASLLSPRTFTLGTLGVGSKIWLVEMSDAFFLLFKTAAGTSWQPSLHMGRVYVPDFPDLDVPLGRDGLGHLFGAPFAGASASLISNANQTSPFPNTTFGVIRLANGINAFPGLMAGIPESATADVAANYGFVRPYTMAMSNPISAFTAQNLSVGRYKYILRTGTNRAPLARIDLNNATDQAFIYGGAVGGTTANPVIIPWLRGVVP